MSEQDAYVRSIQELLFGIHSKHFTELFLQSSETGEAPTKAEMEHAEQLNAILEAAFLVSAADGELTDPEFATLSQAFEQLSNGALQEQDVNTSLTSFADLLDEQSYEDCIDYIAEVLTGAELRKMAFLVAVGVAHSDGQVLDAEKMVIQELAEAFEFSAAKTQDLLSQVEQALEKAKEGD